MTDFTIASGTWPGGATWLIRRSTLRDAFRLALSSRRVTAAGVIVLKRPPAGGMPTVVMTKGKGRDGMPPKWELPSGHIDPINPLNPKGRKESPRHAARREAHEEVGATLKKVSLCVLRVIENPEENTTYPRKSCMTYYVGYPTSLGRPTDGEHTAKSFTLEELGSLQRAGELDLEELKIIRAAILSAGFDQTMVDRALFGLAA